jgi:antitoxin component of MazEF toxin-antitoxin module
VIGVPPPFPIYHMEIRPKLGEIGDSIVITIPSQAISDLNLMAGDNMMLDDKDSTISVRKEDKSKT